jgi:hypothetical protein
MKLSRLSSKILRKIGRENSKTNELGFKELAAIHPLKCLYGGTQKTKLPLLDNYGYMPLKGEFGSL